MQINDFIKEVEKLGISIDDNKLHMLEVYYNELISYNSHTNITGITKKEDVYLKHFYDSLTLFKAVDLNSINNMIDIGSGAGFPGLVIKIFFQNIDLTLLDSNNKKTNFLDIIVKKLGLTNVRIINDRAENYAKENLNKYDLCVSRAVAFIDIISSLSIPFIKKDGKVVLMKGNLTNEKSVLEKHMNDLGINKYDIINFELPYINDERNLVVIEKKSITNKVLDYAKIVKRSKIWNSK